MTVLIICFSININAWGTAINNIAPSSSSSDWYYQIGGGETISPSPHTSEVSFDLMGAAAWGFNASCGNFNYDLSIGAFMNNIKTGADSAINSMVNAASGFVSALPALILQRANPGLYDLLQNGILRADELFNISIKSCEEMEKEFVGGKNPFDDFVTTSKKNAWNDAKQSGGDAISAKRSIEQNGQNQGVPWIGGVKKGGTGQSVLEIVNDISFAGYNMVMDRPPTTTSSPGISGGRLAEVFSTPTAMSQFATNTLGDYLVRTCDGCQKVRAKAGKGLMPVLDRTTETIKTELNNLVAATGNPLYSDLDKVSAHGIRITPQVLQALREEKSAEKTIMLNKLASDIAIAKILEQALMLRRVLHTGKNEPNVSANTQATKIVNTSIDELNKEIENMFFEAEMRKKISTSTVQMVLARKRARDNNVTGAQRTVIQPSKLYDGSVKP